MTQSEKIKQLISYSYKMEDTYIDNINHTDTTPEQAKNLEAMRLDNSYYIHLLQEQFPTIAEQALQEHIKAKAIEMIKAKAKAVRI